MEAILEASDTLDILQGSRSFEHGKAELGFARGLVGMYSDSRNKDYTTCTENDLREGLVKILKDIGNYIGLNKNIPLGDRLPGAYHNDQMLKGRIENAVEVLEGKRVSSADLIGLMPFISDCARDIEIDEHYQRYYPINLPDKIKDRLAKKFYLKNYERGIKARDNGKWISYSEDDAIKREGYIRDVERRVIESAPRWEEEARTARLQAEVNSKSS